MPRSSKFATYLESNNSVLFKINSYSLHFGLLLQSRLPPPPCFTLLTMHIKSLLFKYSSTISMSVLNAFTLWTKAKARWRKMCILHAYMLQDMLGWLNAMMLPLENGCNPSVIYWGRIPDYVVMISGGSKFSEEFFPPSTRCFLDAFCFTYDFVNLLVQDQVLKAWDKS